MNRVTVQYFAYFREKRGLGEEEIVTGAQSLADLYCELADAHGFRLPISSVRVVVGEEFVSMDKGIQNGDAVAFIPPVAGG